MSKCHKHLNKTIHEWTRKQKFPTAISNLKVPKCLKRFQGSVSFLKTRPFLTNSFKCDNARGHKFCTFSLEHAVGDFWQTKREYQFLDKQILNPNHRCCYCRYKYATVSHFVCCQWTFSRTVLLFICWTLYIIPKQPVLIYCPKFVSYRHSNITLRSQRHLSLCFCWLSHGQWRLRDLWESKDEQTSLTTFC